MEGEQSAKEREINITLMSVIAFIKQPYIGKDGRSYSSCVFVFFPLLACSIVPQLQHTGSDGASSLSPGLRVKWLFG